MGVNNQTATVLLKLRLKSLVGQQILSLGRPDLFASRAQVTALGRAFGQSWSDSEIDQCFQQPAADAFLRLIGFQDIRAMDASPYEGADLIHDLNIPIDPALHGSTSLLYDGGTMEHVFNVQVAFENAFKLLKAGGVAVFNSPANGQCGHGFFQFSPEFYFRLLKSNGFSEVDVFMVTRRSPVVWLRCADPLVIRRRVQFSSAEPLDLIVVARKAADTAFVIPQQSDYADSAWSETAAQAESRRVTYRSSLRKELQDRLLLPATVAARSLFGVSPGFPLPGLWRKANFKPIDPLHETLLEA